MAQGEEEWVESRSSSCCAVPGLCAARTVTVAEIVDTWEQPMASRD